MKNAILLSILTAVSLAGGWVLGTVHASPNPEKDCVYAVVLAYPSWDVRASVVESMPECTRLSPAKRAEIRDQFNALVAYALAQTSRDGAP